MKRRTKVNIQKICVNACRILLAVTFIFSGFVKANDPFGMVYKLNDYFAAMGNIVLPELIVLTLAIGLAFIEFTLGIYLFFGINRRNTSTYTVMFMLFMTILTIYIYLFNPVSDCGCFGDVIILSNGVTLLKNIVLLSAAMFVKRYSKMQTEFLPDSLKWLVSSATMIGILIFAALCVMKLPFIDFRPFKIGTDLRANYESYSNANNFEVKIVYEKDGKTIELDIDDDDPDSTWNYVETKRTIKNEKELATSNFFFYDSETEDDITENILYDDNIVILLVIPNLMNADESHVDRINELYELAQDEESISMYCLTSSADEKAQVYWNDHTGAEYKYYIGEERLLKTIIRGNPGLVILQGGVIKGKWSNYNLPNKEELNNWMTKTLKNKSI